MKMEKPTVEAVRFNSADVIATSGGRGVTLSHIGDTNYLNNTFTIDGKSYGPSAGSAGSKTALIEALNSINGEINNHQFTDGNSPLRHSLDLLWDGGDYMTDDPYFASHNGYYEWYNGGTPSTSYWKWIHN